MGDLCVIPVRDRDDPRLRDYRDVREADLRRERGVFVVEGRHNVRRLVAARRHRVCSLLLTPAALRALESDLGALPPDTPVYLADRELLYGIVGYAMHRGCLAVGERPPETDLDALLDSVGPGPATLLGLVDLANPDNVGGAFRSARALGAAGVLLSPATVDPLYRKPIRVSMGGSLEVPFARTEPWPDALRIVRERGFSLVALTTAPSAESIDLVAAPGRNPARALLLVGSEAEGLPEAVVRLADLRVRIPMVPGVDSLNAATAAAIALHRLSRGLPPEEGGFARPPGAGGPAGPPGGGAGG